MNYTLPIFQSLEFTRFERKARGVSWIAPCKPTKFEAWWRQTYEETRKVKKAAYYKKNRAKILKRNCAFKAAVKKEKGKR